MRIAIVGSGVMGTGIAETLSKNEAITEIIWKGSELHKLDSALQTIHSSLDRLVKKGKLSNRDKDCALKKIHITDSYKDLSATYMVIEAVTEDINVKRDVFQKIDCSIDSSTIIATNTSSLSITELATSTSRPEKVIGMHFFNPAPIMKLIEVICALTTSEETKQQTLQFAELLGKETVNVSEAPGFIVNRMLIPMINEAIAILAEGVASAEDIDSAMKFGANHPIGPLSLADLIGNDVNLSIMETLYNETGDPKYRAHPLLRKMVRAQLLGRKTKKGFYNYL